MRSRCCPAAGSGRDCSTAACCLPFGSSRRRIDPADVVLASLCRTRLRYPKLFTALPRSDGLALVRWHARPSGVPAAARLTLRAAHNRPTAISPLALGGGLVSSPRLLITWRAAACFLISVRYQPRGASKRSRLDDYGPLQDPRDRRSVRVAATHSAPVSSRHRKQHAVTERHTQRKCNDHPIQARERHQVSPESGRCARAAPLRRQCGLPA